MSSRPPNAMEHNANHAHPRSNPATTSLNQCTPSRTARGTDHRRTPCCQARTEDLRVLRAPAGGQQGDRGERRRRRGGVT